MTFIHVLTNCRHLALISLIDRLIHKTTYKVNVATRNIKHMGHRGRRCFYLQYLENVLQIYYVKTNDAHVTVIDIQALSYSHMTVSRLT